MQKALRLAASVDQSGGGQDRPQFSEDTFLQHLVNFIVADDQVCQYYCSIETLLTSFFSVDHGYRVSRIPRSSTFVAGKLA